jgi:hypothetical protein
MKQINIFLLLLTAFVFSGCAPKAPIEGFRDMKWGDSAEKLGNYTVTYDNKTSKVISAVKKNEYLQINEAKLTGIKYFFFNDMLYAVVADYNGIRNNNVILQAVTDKYGIDRVTDKEYEPYINGYKIVNDKVVENIEYKTRYLATPSFWNVKSGEVEIDGVCVKTTDCRMEIVNRKILNSAAEYAKKIKKIQNDKAKTEIEKGVSDL